MRALGWVAVVAALVVLYRAGHLDPTWTFVQACAGWVAGR